MWPLTAQQLLTLLCDCGPEAGKVSGSSSVVRESQQRETILVGLSLSHALVSILCVEEWKRNPVPLLS